MADERRLLQSLERVRLRGPPPMEATASTSNGVSGLDDIEAQLHAAVAAADATPSRRKSSALTLSHLAAATPPSHRINATRDGVGTPPVKSAVANQAVRDLARELEAVEARLSGFRRRREASETTDEPKSEEPRKQDIKGGVAATEEAPRTQQRAGEVADEVEHALATCDRLLNHAKLQASAASLTRSLRSSGSGSGSGTGHALSSPGRRFSDNSLPTSSTSRRMERPSSVKAEEMELEATARTMRALVASREAEIEREADRIVAQNQQTQARQLQELQRKAESKRKMVLLTLREQCEEETRAVVKQAMLEHEQVEQEAVRRVEERLLDERDRLLHDILLQHQQDTETHVQRVRVKVQGETLAKKQQLEKQLKHEFESQLKQIDEDAAVELQRWEDKQRLAMESDVLTRREQAAAAILRAQEVKTNELKQQLQQQCSKNEQDELEKLKKALTFGAQAQLQQLRKKSEAEHAQNMNDTRTEAALALENKLVDLKQVLTLAHKQELEQLKRDLEKRHRVTVMELHEQMENDHRSHVEELSEKASKELENVLAIQRKELEAQNEAKLAALEQTLDRDHRVRMHQLDMENDEQCEQALQQLRKRITETQQQELEAKHARMVQAKATLLDEAVRFLSVRSDDRNSLSGRTQSTEALVHLKQLGSQQLPKELQRAVSTLVKDFEELTEEQSVLVDKISECTGLYLTFKRQNAQMESEIDELRHAVQTLHAQLQTKDALAKKLYMANEALLTKLGLSGDLD